jgi:DNA repair exonuclease SbcCD ATPase subunit
MIKITAILGVIVIALGGILYWQIKQNGIIAADRDKAIEVNVQNLDVFSKKTQAWETYKQTLDDYVKLHSEADKKTEQENAQMRMTIKNLKDSLNNLSTMLSAKEKEKLAILENNELDKEAKEKLLKEKEDEINALKNKIQGIQCLQIDMPDDIINGIKSGVSSQNHN